MWLYFCFISASFASVSDLVGTSTAGKIISDDGAFEYHGFGTALWYKYDK